MFGLVSPLRWKPMVVALPPAIVLGRLTGVGRPLLGRKQSFEPSGLRWRRRRGGLTFFTDLGAFSANTHAHKPFAAVDVRVDNHPSGAEVSVIFRATRTAPGLRLVAAVLALTFLAGFVAEGQWGFAAVSTIAALFAGRTWPSDRLWYEQRRREAENWLRPVFAALTRTHPSDARPPDPYMNEVVLYWNEMSSDPSQDEDESA